MSLSVFRRILVSTVTIASVLVGVPLAAPASAQSPGITVQTYGWGHGVGMGQHGAQGMALGGSSYRQILQYFYTDVSVGAAAATHTNRWNDVRVQIRSTNDPVEIKADGNVTLQVPSGTPGGNLTLASGESVLINTVGGNLTASVRNTAGQQRAHRTMPATATVAVALNGNRARTISTTWGETPYRHGRIVVHGSRHPDCAQHCVGVDGMTMNQYLTGLVEMPGSWHAEALKAQAVAGRSYAAPKVQAPRATGFHLQDSVLDQAWRGDSGTGGGWPAAVNATANEVITYTGADTAWRGRIIDAYYSASTGGHTENSEYVWTAVRPWARAKPDPGDGWSGNPHRRSYSYSAAELSAWFGVANVNDVRIVGNIGASGRTNRASVRVEGTTVWEGSANDFRQVINQRAGTRRIDTFNFRVDASGLGVSGDRLSTASGVALADRGYWVTNPQGAVSARGFAPYHGSMAGRPLNAPVLGMAANPAGTGYWLVARDGGIFTFGSVAFHGSTGAMRLNQPVVGMTSTHNGNGYWLVARDGGIFTFGNAPFYGSTGAMRLNQPVIGMARTGNGQGYWLLAGDGGIFTFGNASFRGSLPSIGVSTPAVAMAPTPDGGGYWIVTRDGGVYTFGNASFHGSLGGSGLTAVGIAPSRTGRGYWLVTSDGSSHRFGDA
ncbi:MAG: SpoIID/LytB domain-containing protein [Acidimicrobiales bacterium]